MLTVLHYLFHLGQQFAEHFPGCCKNNLCFANIIRKEIVDCSLFSKWIRNILIQNNSFCIGKVYIDPVSTFFVTASQIMTMTVSMTAAATTIHYCLQLNQLSCKIQQLRLQLIHLNRAGLIRTIQFLYSI